ncbi:MAG: putative nucleic acid-binding protein, contains PIN domain protein [Halonotius sp. J07HN6]|nr:MAG: putative nucleic acid-binding protein, contains PIN domain protein [Halonotius sp. J07HN6]
MIFLDSWVWLEYVFGGEQAAAAADAIQRANTADTGGLISPTVIAEASYRVRRVEDEATAEETVRVIHDFKHIESMPLVDEIAEYAAALRAEYYDPGERELSYADAIHLATAVVHDDCDVLYSGDPDFEGIDAIETVVL